MRVLLLGTTGVNKRDVWTAVKQERLAHTQEGNVSLPRLIEFEKDYLEREVDGPLYRFLDMPEDAQARCWTAAWARFSEEFSETTEDIAVALHAVLIRSDFGTRTFLAPELLRAIGFTHVVTLMDDVYSCWSRTEVRAAGDPWIGRPSLLQLIASRQGELLMGDLAARSLGLHNTLLPVLHPARVLERLLFSETTPRAVYLSFPITGPRARDDDSGEQELSGYLRQLADIERELPSVICFCPLAIDELPLAQPLPQVERPPIDAAEEPELYAIFEPAKRRWNVRSFWPTDQLMGEPVSETIELPLSQVIGVRGALFDEVGIRDYRLLAQAQALAVFNPRFDGKRPRGVRHEMARAAQIGREVHVFQNPQYDPDGVIRKEYAGDPGTMGSSAQSRYTVIHPDLESMLTNALKAP